MIDRVIIEVRGGDGGDGCIAFRREKHVPRGGPSGGDGGRGGNVVLVASESVTTLIDQYYSQHYAAERGEHGKGKLCHGADGADRRVLVPVGTLVYDADTDELIADLNRPGMAVVVARGGRGGRGNAAFKSSTYRAPRVAEKGEPGEYRRLRLEVRLIADVGLVGFPNAGKSTLLARVSDARPKIADYPFTTLEPQLGVVRLGPEENFVLADLPGLIEGAHRGVGLGHDFLRHVERTALLLHVVDLAAVDGRDPVEDFHTINAELRAYSAELARRPQLIVLNKSDLPQAQSNLPRVLEALEGKPLFVVSAATGEGVPELMRAAYRSLQELRRIQAEEESPPESPERVEWRPRGGLTVFREGSGFRVESEAVQRAVVMTDFENEEAVWLLHRRLERMGLFRALQRAGAQEGDPVFIGEMELEYSERAHPATFADYLASKRPTHRRQDWDQHPHRRRKRARSRNRQAVGRSGR